MLFLSCGKKGAILHLSRLSKRNVPQSKCRLRASTTRPNQWEGLARSWAGTVAPSTGTELLVSRTRQGPVRPLGLVHQWRQVVQRQPFLFRRQGRHLSPVSAGQDLDRRRQVVQLEPARVGAKDVGTRAAEARPCAWTMFTAHAHVQLRNNVLPGLVFDRAEPTVVSVRVLMSLVPRTRPVKNRPPGFRPHELTCA